MAASASGSFRRSGLQKLAVTWIGSRISGGPLTIRIFGFWGVNEPKTRLRIAISGVSERPGLAAGHRFWHGERVAPQHELCSGRRTQCRRLPDHCLGRRCRLESLGAVGVRAA